MVGRVAALRSTHHHSIEIASDPEVADLRLGRYTCFMHAFGLVYSTPVKEIARTFPETYPSREFVRSLIARYLSEIGRADTLDGDVVVYLNGDTITHVGKMRLGRVVSKWGTGHLWEHGIPEVPDQYGNTARFYHAIGRTKAEEAFVAYAKQREGAEVIDQLLGT